MKYKSKFVTRGQFDGVKRYFEKVKNVFKMGTLDKYGKMGVAALEAFTPVDSGVTALSWGYEIKYTDTGVNLYWTNSNVNDGYVVAVLLQYGHANHGGWVMGVDYINPAMEPVFEAITKGIWLEVTENE